MFVGEISGGLEAGESWEEGWAGKHFDDVSFDDSPRTLARSQSDEGRHVLPDLDSIPPGPFLMAILTSVDRSKLNGYDAVRLLQARERLVAYLQAEAQRDMTEIAHAGPGDASSKPRRLPEAFDFAADEIRAALALTRGAAQTRLNYATDLVERLPQVLELLHCGAIDWAKARVFVDGTAHLSTEEARAVVDELAERAPRLTTGQLRARIRKLAVEADPQQALKRYEQRLEERRLWVEPTDEGTANLYLLDIPLHDAQSIRNRIRARVISTPKIHRQGRTVQQLEADIAVDVLKGHDPESHTAKGSVDLRLSLATLGGLDDQAGWVDGIEPVVADIARQVADLSHDAEWHFTVTDDNGTIVHIGTTRRRPTKALSRLVESLQPTCSGPGCRMPASQCDFDHLDPWRNLGPTSDRNGGPKCRHDHRLKDHGWNHERSDRSDVWTTPLGHTYTYPINDDHPP